MPRYPKRSFCSLAATVILSLGLSSGVARADFTKTIQVIPGVQVNAVTTWYFENCTTSLGLGSYTINVAPSYGSLAFADLSAPLPGCPVGSPDLPAVAAYYTWTASDSTATSDYFQLFYELNGQVAEVIDVTVVLSSTAPPACTIASQTVDMIPGIDNSRTVIGVGERVQLSSTPGPVTWSIESGGGGLSEPSEVSGSLGCLYRVSDNPVSGTNACFLAPYSTDTTVVTATLPSGPSCSISFSTTQPSGLVFQRLKSPPLPPPGYAFLNAIGPFFEAAMDSVIFVTPGNVSFANINISEHDIKNPYVAPPYIPPVLVPVVSGDAWLVGCDYDHNFSFTNSPFSAWNSYFTYSDPFGGHQTEFSRTETFLLHAFGSNSVTYLKHQTQALAADGSWVDTPLSLASVLDIPWDSRPSRLGPINRASCLADVQSQFGTVPSETPSGATSRAGRLAHK